MNNQHSSVMHATTVVAARIGNAIAIGSDGQVTLGNTIVKHSARKIRRIALGAPDGSGDVLVGFAGSTADAFTLFDRFEGKVKEFKDDLRRAAVELAKEWRTEKMLRHLEAMMIACNSKHMLMLSGMGDVIEPEYDVLAIGSGGPFAYAAARALLASEHARPLSAREVVERSLAIAGEICIYTNTSIHVEELHG